MNDNNGQMAVAAESERSVISAETWELIRTANMRGVPIRELSEKYGVTRDAIRQKRCRDKVWQAVVNPDVVIENAGIINESSQAVTVASDSLSLAQKVASSVSESIAAVGQQNRLLALQIASKGLSRANEANLPVKDWSDVKILADITAKLTGLEGGNAVQVNVITDGSGHFSEGDFPAFDIEG